MQKGCPDPLRVLTTIDEASAWLTLTRFRVAGRSLVGLRVGVPYRIQLYMHCGIDFWIRFDGNYWNAVGYDNSTGNPPEGLGNPADFGTMTLLSEKEAEYVSESGKVIRFTRAAERPKGMVCL